MSSSLPEHMGSRECPVAGLAEEFNPFTEPYLGNPYAFWEIARERQPTFYSEQLGYWLVSRYADVKQVLNDSANFSAAISITPLRPLCPAAAGALSRAEMVMGPSLVNEDPPEHTRRRKYIRDALVSPRRLEEVRPRIVELTGQFIDQFIDKGRVDLVSEFAWEIPALVVFAIMGVPDEDIARAKQFANRLALFTWGFPSDADQLALAEGMAEYWRYAREHVRRRLEAPTDDYISDLIHAWREPGNEDLFDEEYLVTTMMNFLFAGHETTTNATANGLRALLEHRDQWDALCADPKLASNAVEESLRFSSSVIAWRRRAVTDTVVGETLIPAGANVLVVTGSANHDEDVFEDPGRFDLSRSNARRHFAFGHGRHLCLGAPLARIEMEIFFTELSRRIPQLRLVAGQEFSYSPNTSFRGPDHLYAEWDPTLNPVTDDRPA